MKDTSELATPGPSASEDVPPVQDVGSLPALTETGAVVEVPEQTVNENTKHADEIPVVSAPLEEPPHMIDSLSDQGRHVQSEEEAERPKSPWTPSYTVTTLPGSSSSPRIDSKPELEGAEVQAPPVEKAKGVETPKIFTPQDEDPVGSVAIAESPWTQSYSVASQPGSPRLSPMEELKELEPEPQPIEPVQETPVVGPVAGFVDVPETVVTPAVEGEDTGAPNSEEESKPVWTQSYSVVSQPGSPRVSPKQVSEEIPEIEEIKPPWTQSYSVISQPGSPRIPPKEDSQDPTVEPVAVGDDPIAVVTPVEEATTAPAPEDETTEQPNSTWTPSYSVTTLDSPSKQASLEEAEPEPEVLPVPEALAPEPGPEADVPIPGTSEPLAAKDEQPERPKSPWTPSYSVTTLPGSSSAEEPSPGTVEGEPSVDAEPLAKAAEPVENVPKENGATSDVFEVHEAISPLTVRDEPQVDTETPGPDRQGLDLVSRSC